MTFLYIHTVVQPGLSRSLSSLSSFNLKLLVIFSFHPSRPWNFWNHLCFYWRYERRAVTTSKASSEVVTVRRNLEPPLFFHFLFLFFAIVGGHKARALCPATRRIDPGISQFSIFYL